MTRNIVELIVDSAKSGSISLAPCTEAKSLAEEYRCYAKATAEGILKLAEILVRAEEELQRDGFADFLKAVGLEGREATISKHRTIGKSAERLRAVGDSLPNSWTTLYALARMAPDEFERIKDDISAHMTAAKVRDLLSQTIRRAAPQRMNTQPATGIRTISIRFDGDGALEEFLKALAELKQRFSFEFDAPVAVAYTTGADEAPAAPLDQAA